MKLIRKPYYRLWRGAICTCIGCTEQPSRAGFIVLVRSHHVSELRNDRTTVVVVQHSSGSQTVCIGGGAPSARVLGVQNSPVTLALLYWFGPITFQS
jgi:hypothetical protein